jgi:CheY-like chemotaxis protein
MNPAPLREFGATAKALSRNPLGIIALFIVLVYGLACLVVITGGSLTTSERFLIICFLVGFPFVVLGVFTYLVSFRADQLFAPSDYGRGEYLELQKMRLSAVASLTVAKQTKDGDRQNPSGIVVDELIQSVERAVALTQEGTVNPTVLWVDDSPSNNTFERRAMEAVGIRFVLSLTTTDALKKLSGRTFDAVISDMGRPEGPREGYVLLDAMRAKGDETPLFFYASSNAPEHKQEAYDHGGQGCTNDGQELFEMVTRTAFGSQQAQRLAYRRQGDSFTRI